MREMNSIHNCDALGQECSPESRFKCRNISATAFSQRRQQSALLVTQGLRSREVGWPGGRRQDGRSHARGPRALLGEARLEPRGGAGWWKGPGC